MTPETIDAPKPRPPRTETQKQASRQNGAHSRGPSTPAGKLRSSKSAIRHGLTASEHTLLMTEDPEQYQEVCDSFIDDLRPATKAELRLVEKIGNLDWRLERLVMMETALQNMAAGANAEEILADFKNIDGIGLIVEAWKKDSSVSQCHDLLRRYMGTLQHQFNSMVVNFEKFESRRLARKLNPDYDPNPPYLRPAFHSFEAGDPKLQTDASTDKDEECQPEQKPPQPPVGPALAGAELHLRSGNTTLDASVEPQPETKPLQIVKRNEPEKSQSPTPINSGRKSSLNIEPPQAQPLLPARSCDSVSIDRQTIPNARRDTPNKSGTICASGSSGPGGKGEARLAKKPDETGQRSPRPRSCVSSDTRSSPAEKSGRM